MRGVNMKLLGTMVTTIAFIVLLALGGAGGVSASQPTDPPGQGECDHGNSQQSCKPDPQPSNGQDCLDHGPANGGVNEDHCASTPPEVTPSPTVEPSATPSNEPSATPSATATPVPSVKPTPPAVIQTPEAPTPPSTDTTDVSAQTPNSPLLLVIAAILGLSGALTYGLLGPRARMARSRRR